MSMVRAALCAALVVAVGGCASLTRGDKQKMKFDTDPPGATVEVDGKTCETPGEIPLKRKQKYVVNICAEGYQPIQFTLQSRWDGASLGNLIMPGGSVGFVIDWLNGSDRKFNELQPITLRKVEVPTTQPLVLRERKGKLLTAAEYDAAEAADKNPRLTKQSQPLPQDPPSDVHVSADAKESADVAYPPP